jgi:hypothetical protein
MRTTSIAWIMATAFFLVGLAYLAERARRRRECAEQPDQVFLWRILARSSLYLCFRIFLRRHLTTKPIRLTSCQEIKLQGAISTEFRTTVNRP